MSTAIKAQIFRLSLIFSREVESMMCYINGKNNGQPAKYQDLITSLKADGSNLADIVKEFNKSEANDTPKKDIPKGVKTAANLKAAEYCFMTDMDQYFDDYPAAMHITNTIYKAMMVGEDITPFVESFCDATNINSYIDRVAKGQDDISRINNVIAAFKEYNMSSTGTVYEYLGLTEEEYLEFEKNPHTIHDVINQREAALMSANKRRPT